jgi:hypothetical protein
MQHRFIITVELADDDPHAGDPEWFADACTAALREYGYHRAGFAFEDAMTLRLHSEADTTFERLLSCLQGYTVSIAGATGELLRTRAGHLDLALWDRDDKPTGETATLSYLDHDIFVW